MPIDRRQLITSWGRACELGNAGVFVGAGVSKASNMPDWLELLEDPCKESDIPLTPEVVSDLPLAAEYLIVDGRYNSERLDAHILTRLTSRQFEPNAIHHSIAQLPVDQIWTTNYDFLIEEAASGSDLIASDDDVQTLGASRRAIIKMHGSITPGPPPTWYTRPIITRTDYEKYELDRPRTWALLHAAYLSKSLLFIGFSFADPNVEILQRLSRRYGTAESNRHVTVMKRPPAENVEERRIFSLRVMDLEANGIQVHEIDSHEELPQIMTSLVRRTRRPRLFISGSEQAEGDHRAACDALGVELADRHEWELCSLEGPSGWHVTKRVAAIRKSEGNYDASKLEFYYRRKNEPPPQLDDRIGTVTFTDSTREELVPELLDGSRGLVVLGGGARTDEEIEWAKAAGVGVVPIPAAGGAGRRYWEAHRDSPPDLGGQVTPSEVWRRLGSDDLQVATRAAMQLLAQTMYSTDT